jgi:hypothetical protein
VSGTQHAPGAGIDFIGDIHGHYEHLVQLLKSLGYEAIGPHGYRHPEGRKVVFLGDYIDRGPMIRETLQTVRAMVDSGDAWALMGNHEFNAIAFATPLGSGGHLRPHSERNLKQHGETLAQFQGAADEWKEWLEWFKSLPMWVDFSGVRAVHACWDESSMKILEDPDFTDSEFLRLCSTEGEPEFLALETILKGPELPLPPGSSFADKQGIRRSRIRARWWGMEDASLPATFQSVAIPPGSCDCDSAVPRADLDALPSYDDAIPVLVGHYWIPATTNPEPLASNVGCLDFSVGLGGPLVAYRWDGEAELCASRMVAVSQ